jgi:Putative auto-transporter adhesin, head GIN domain
MNAARNRAPHGAVNRSRRGLVVGLALAASLAAAAMPARAQAPEGRRYAPGPFNAVVISGTASARIVQGSEDSVFIEGDEDAQQAIRLDQEGNGVLRVHPGGSWKFWRGKPPQLTITVRDLRRLEIRAAADVVASGPFALKQLLVRISGAGSVRFERLKAERLEINISGVGLCEASGTVDELEVAISGRGSWFGENLASQRADVAMSGAGDVKVWAIKELDVSVSGVGNIDVWGNPMTVRRKSSGLTNWNEHGNKRAP